jgi:hypothetical protein
MEKRFLITLLLVLIGIINLGIAQQIDILRIEQMPNTPEPYEMRDWRKVALGYDSLVFDFSQSGEHLPLVWLNTQTVNYPQHNSFGLETAVGTYSPGNAEGINIIPAVVGATLVDIDKSNQNGYDWVLMCEEFFNNRPEESVYLNGWITSSGNDWWYDTMPNIFFYQLYDLYRGTGDFEYQFMSVADQWLRAVEAMGGDVTPWAEPDMNYRAFSLSQMEPLDIDVRQPEAAGAIGWILYNAYVETGEENYRIGAEWCLEFLSNWTSNPFYELQLPFGVYAAARMNAELGTSYDIYKMTNWCFTPTGNVRYWGATLGNWGGYDCDGLIGEAMFDGYAFIMNGFEQAGALVPMVRYDDRFARAIGKWMLNLANASRLFYTNYLPDENQDGESWSQTYDPKSYIAHEALREVDLNSDNTPFATGDFTRGGWGATNYALYGSSHVGIFGGIIDTTNIEMILKLDVLKTDYFGDASYPSYLYYNPYDTSYSVEINVGSGTHDLYDAILNEFINTQVTGVVSFDIPADEAMLLVITPANGNVRYDLDKLIIDDIVVDYNSDVDVTNYPPRIKALVCSLTEVPRESQTQIYCTAEDKDDDPLTYEWSSEAGSIESENSIATWTAPDSAGIFDLMCIVGDNNGDQDTAVVSIEVLQTRNPEISDLTADPSEIELGKNTVLTCFASDPDGDKLTYRWTSSAGSFQWNDSAQVVWSAPEETGYYYIYCKVEDGQGGETIDSVGVSVGRLVAYFPFNGNAQDESGYNNHGVVSGAELTPDREGTPNSAYYFDGVDDHIRIQNHPSLNFKKGISVIFWMRIDEFFGREAHPVSHGNWENRWKVSITGTKVRWTVKTDVGIKDLDTEQNVTTGIFYYMSVIYTNNRMEIYIDGQPASSTTWNGDILQTSIDFMIGQVLPGNSNYNFKGIIDDVSIYNYALSSSEIEDLFDQSTPIKAPADQGVPQSYSLLQNYPNPFNPSTIINYELPITNDVQLSIFNLMGQKIATLVSERQEVGYHSVQWDASGLASGVYYYQIKAGAYIDIKKMLLLK